MKRILQLDGIRALAFLAVFANHTGAVPLMWVGVDAFFVLSGFLITTILLGMKGVPASKYFGQFYLRRARRILPPYCLAVLLAIVLGASVEWRSVWIWMIVFSSNIPVAFNLGNMGPLTPLWSLAVEEHFYLAWPLIIFSVDRQTLRRIILALIITLPLLRAIFTPLASSYLTIYTLTPFRIDMLAAGSLIALYWEQDQERVIAWHMRAKWTALCAGVIFCVSALLFPAFRAKANSMIFNTCGYSLSVVMFTAVVVYVITLSGGMIYKLLTNALLCWLGTISYMCYLVHDIFINILGPRNIVHIAGAFTLTIIFSALSWRYMEAPILGKSRKVVRQVIPPPAPQTE